MKVGDVIEMHHPVNTGIRTHAWYSRIYPRLHRVGHWFGHCFGPPLPKGPVTLYRCIATSDDDSR